MRRLSKPWPPTDVSPNGQPSRSFSDAEEEYLLALPQAANPSVFARNEFNRLEKSKLRTVMYVEQRSICAFCERRIQDTVPVPRIDHWRPLSLNHKLALHWINLYLSCPTGGTCDDAKGDRPFKWEEHDPDLPWPTDFDFARHIGFTSRGEMYVRNDTGLSDARRRILQLAIDDQPDGSQIRKAILNLNHPALVAARAAAIDSERTRMERDFRDVTASRGEREKRACDRLDENPLQPFVSIRVCWLRKLVGRGR